jgi:hypothetical protein
MLVFLLQLATMFLMLNLFYDLFILIKSGMRANMIFICCMLVIKLMQIIPNNIANHNNYNHLIYHAAHKCRTISVTRFHIRYEDIVRVWIVGSCKIIFRKDFSQDKNFLQTDLDEISFNPYKVVPSVYAFNMYIKY